MARISFGGVAEEVVTREEYTLDRARETLRDERIVVVGYGVQGPAQALNLRDNGFNVRVGLLPERKRSWNKALGNGWVPGETLLPPLGGVPPPCPLPRHGPRRPSSSSRASAASSGVSICTRVCRTTTLMLSSAPMMNIMPIESQKFLDMPKTIVAAPNPTIAQTRVTPARFRGG